MVKEPEHLLEEALNEPLAIIGMNCQFPGIDADIEDVEALNEMLLKAISPIKEIPPERWDVNEYYDPDRNKTDKMVSRKGGFLTNIHLFDAAFFKISALEAKQMDPQHRLFLEVAVRALNHANIPLESLNGTNTAVYCGMSTYEYSQLNYKDKINFNAYTAIGMAPSAAAGRLSHFLNLKGPSITVDTACSSSLSAIYLASTALRTKQCDLAIVGGVHLSLSPEGMLGFSKANMLSAKGQCSSFDVQADGFVCSEGCGIIILQRVSDAITAKNKIYALIKSIVMNQDGDGTGLAAPNIESQIAMHKNALQEAQLQASDIDYIEAHGSGTVLGDSVEFNAIRQVHEGQHSQENPLIIGAVKSILGHTISSSGIASLLKVIGALNQGIIPPNLHFLKPNNTINPEAIPALLPNQAYAFPYLEHKKRRAQVANFSFSGTNVSAILEEGLPTELVGVPGDELKLKCFIVSAQSEASLNKMLEQYVSYLQASSAPLHDICCTLINCRDHFRYRCALFVKDKESLIKKLATQDYEIKKVAPNKKVYPVNLDADLIYKLYLAGENIKLDPDSSSFNKVELPLYHFDRKDYWHEVRKEAKTPWLHTLLHHTKEEQCALIKEWLAKELGALLNKETIDEHTGLASLGINKSLKDDLERTIKHSLGCPISSPLPDYLTVEQLAGYIQQLSFPEPIQRQPSINILNNEPIAIIGMSCRYPQAESVQEFLELLSQGKNGITDIPLERWDNEKYYDEDVETLGKLYIRQLGLLDNIKDFDADFFNISPREAKLMAPQLRLFLEGSYHALEDANLSLDKVKDSKTGVFVGIGTNEYPDILAEEGISLEELNIYFATGNVLNAVAGRVAYSFDFHGPIQVIDTACSSSMTAIHNACTSLQAGDCDVALAGGINILLSPYSNITLCKAKMLSPESRCKTFSDDADGYARSEGYGILVLKRLSTALAEQDNILAVIKGSAINSDGKSGGFTVPNGSAQEEVIRKALAKAELEPGDIDYIEAHGTGTPLADPIEANTLMTIFADSHSPAHPLYLSSAKTNIGHSESASGVAGVIKGVLSLQEKQLFKHLNFRSLNPGIELRNTIIPLETLSWDKPQGLRALGVSSFGFSGANAHVVLQEMPTASPVARTLPAENVLVLSAKSKESLELLLARYADYLLGTSAEWADICYTAASCRAHFLYRVALIAHSKSDAALAIKGKKYEIHVIKKEQGSLQHYQQVTQIQEAYQQGYKIDWPAYYKSFNLPFTKVKLPLYAFAGKEYWYEEKDKIKDKQLPKDWCFQLQWQQQSLNKNNAKVLGKNWLLIGSSELAEPLRQQGLSVALEENYQLAELNGIIFDLPLSPAANLDELLEHQKNNLKLVLAWVRTLYEKGLALQLVILTSNAVAELVKGSSPLNHGHAALLGFCKTLVLEQPQYRTILLDITEENAASKAAFIVNELEFNHDGFYEHQVAYRDNKRFVPRLKKTTINETKRALYSKGRYLITGGSGGLGFISAQALLSAGAKEVVLLARHVDKEEFQKNVKRISSYYPGRIIKTLSLDLTDKAKLAKVLAELNGDGQLKGIIHTAGAAIKAPLTEHQDDDVDYLFAAKVKGAWYLHELSKDFNLDCFIVYSSISSAFGSNKESVYSGANSCLDLLIAQRQAIGLTGTSVQWGPWGEVGMAQKRSRDESLKKALISNEQGHHFFKLLLTANPAELAIISPEYLQFMLDFVPQPPPLFYKQLEHDLLHKELTEERSISTWLQSYLELTGEERFLACKTMLTNVCKDILDAPTMEELDEDQGFFELGFDSLMVAELANELKKKLEPALKIMINIGFNYPTINKLARHIEEELNLKLVKQASAASPSKNDNEEIAVIGMSCSFPQAPNIHAFEQLLAEGRNGMRDIPKDRWDNSAYFDPDPNVPGKSYVTKLGLIDHIKEFDAAFFGISPREAKLIDPQQRLFLECCYTAIEQANYPLKNLTGSLTGVFAGVGPNEYFTQLEKSGFTNEELSMYSITGNVLNLIPGRVAYFFDFKGPSLSVDTACSSSLVAIHYACQSLKSGEIDYALAGGVNVILLPESNITLCKARALSPDGQCKTFDAAADGYARAEGCGVLLLKRLGDALRDKDNILAVIKASAVNNDGKSVGLTVPNGKSQEEVMLKALKQSQLASADISYIEAHGTGTPIGDPIEVHAINQVYGLTHSQDNPLYLGAVKTNIGHLESASGVAGVIKTILSLKNKKLYKHLHFKRLNSSIHLNDTLIPLETTDWHSNTPLRYAGVNAFGFSGTNAHLIMQEHVNPSHPSPKHPVGRYLLTLSARSKNSLESLVHLYQGYLESTHYDFADICFTAATCRTHYPYRIVVAASTAQEARDHLSKGLFALSYGEDNTAITDPILRSLLLAYLKDKEVDWLAFYRSLNIEPQKVELPTYPFNRVEFWPDKNKDETTPAATSVALKPSLLEQPKSSLLMTLKTQNKLERIATLETILRQITAKILEMNPEEISLQQELFALGLDSLMAVDIRSKIHDKLRCPTLSISMEYFINQPRIATIAKVIAEELNAVFSLNEEEYSRTETVAKEVVLTDSQYSLWCIDQFNWSFNLGMQFHLAGELNRDYVHQAFAAVVNNNAAFWIDFNKNLPTQTLRRQGKLELTFKDFSAGEKSRELDNWFYTNIIEMFPLNHQPLMRVFLYKIKEDLHEVHVIIPHIIAEGKSCDLVMEQFRTNYELLVAKKPLPILPLENNYFSYVQSYNYHCLKNLAAKIKFWSEYNKGVQRLYLGQKYHLPDAAILQEHYMWHYPLANSVVEQFITWHRAKNLNISSGLIALTHIVFYALGANKTLPLTLIHTGREGDDYKTTIGLFAEYKRINNVINENNHFIDCIHFIDEQMLKTAPYQKCPSLIKEKNVQGAAPNLMEYLIYLGIKLKRGKSFKALGLHPYLNKLYLFYLSRITFSNFSGRIRGYLNRWFGLPLLKPAALHALISVTPSFFAKQTPSTHIGNLELSYPNYFAFADRPVGNKALWVYFTRDQFGEYQLSLNGPLTQQCQNEIAKLFNDLMVKILEDEKLRVGDLITRD
ncbi:SDR family NAD(P)-dependent oxidoreductase [Legionella sp. km772]|uniref:SDR family NAD(P)-dependent oxidoreductase n=1 Tax=Legionella sp. km772 TaxID=2498111 RepID=UPI001F2AB86F|nr:SDR family NAD(P)-dependent oxidoreductase [Legionella sp. km772]